MRGDMDFFDLIISEVVREYLRCGDLREGFARVRCPDCSHEYVLALCLLKFSSLTRVINMGYDSNLKWPDDLFQRLNQAGKESTCIIRYDAQKGKWPAKYQFFGQAAGPESEIKKEAYIMSIQLISDRK